MIYAGMFDLEYSLSSLIRSSAETWVGHIDLSRRIFGYLKNYQKRGYEINLQPLTVGVDYYKVNMNYDFGNQYE